MGMRDVWVPAQRRVHGGQSVRADTIVQVKWESKSSRYLTLMVTGGDEVHHQVRPHGSVAEPFTEEDGAASAGGLLSAMAKSAPSRAVTCWSSTAPDRGDAVPRRTAPPKAPSPAFSPSTPGDWYRAPGG